MLNDVVEPTRIQLIDATDNTFTADNPHAFDAFTVTIPVDDGTVPNVALMIFVPWPVLIVAPPGTVHVYDVAPDTVAMLYTLPALEVHTVVGPLIAPGKPGTAFTDKLRTNPVPQLFDAATVTVPVENDPLKSTTIDDPLDDPTMLAPDGTVHTYDTAPDTGVTLYTTPVNPHNPSIGPLIDAAAGKMFCVIVAVRAGLVPQLFTAITDNVPPTTEVYCTVITFEPAPDKILAPDGTDQL
jgi:hypothetical protein